MKNKAIPDTFAGEPVELPQGHPAVAAGKVGVLLVNLGTPEGTDYWPMRRYLAEFLSDRRVIEWPRALWYPILYGIVLNTRPQKSGAAYRTIWNNERNAGAAAHRLSQLTIVSAAQHPHSRNGRMPTNRIENVFDHETITPSNQELGNAHASRATRCGQNHINSHQCDISSGMCIHQSF